MNSAERTSNYDLVRQIKNHVCFSELTDSEKKSLLELDLGGWGVDWFVTKGLLEDTLSSLDAKAKSGRVGAAVPREAIEVAPGVEVSNYTLLESISRQAKIPVEVTREKEVDPNGRDLNTPGAKADAGKVRPALVLGGFSRALLEVSKVGTGGAKKYSDSGWVEVPEGVARYSEAMLRHWLKEQTGEAADPDTGLLHAAHLAWNSLARLDLMLRKQESFGGVTSSVTDADFLKGANK